MQALTAVNALVTNVNAFLNGLFLLLQECGSARRGMYIMWPPQASILNQRSSTSLSNELIAN